MQRTETDAYSGISGLYLDGNATSCAAMQLVLRAGYGQITMASLNSAAVRWRIAAAFQTVGSCAALTSFSRMETGESLAHAAELEALAMAPDTSFAAPLLAR